MGDRFRERRLLRGNAPVGLNTHSRSNIRISHLTKDTSRTTSFATPLASSTPLKLPTPTTPAPNFPTTCRRRAFPGSGAATMPSPTPPKLPTPTTPTTPVPTPPSKKGSDGPWPTAAAAGCNGPQSGGCPSARATTAIGVLATWWASEDEAVHVQQQRWQVVLVRGR